MFASVAVLIVANLAFLGGSFGQMENDISADAGNAVSPEAAMAYLDKVFKETCEKNGGAEAYTKALDAANETVHCLLDVVNFQELQGDAAQAQQSGVYNAVIQKYCQKMPPLKDCYRNGYSSFELCFTPDERDAMRETFDTLESILDFACFENGKRIVSFIDGGGPICLLSKRDEIQSCMKSITGISVPANEIGPNFNIATKTRKLKWDIEGCTQMASFKDCLVKELKTCSNPTAGDLVESLYNHLNEDTPCKNLLSKGPSNKSLATGKSNASPIVIGVHVIALSLFTLRFV